MVAKGTQVKGCGLVMGKIEETFGTLYIEVCLEI